MSTIRSISIRVTPQEVALLDTMVAEDKATLAGLGIIGEVNYATILRKLMTRELDSRQPPKDPRQLEIPTPAPTPKATKKRTK